MQEKEYEIKYKELPNNLNMVQIEFKNKIVIYINSKAGENNAK